jgi:hypothetical protein
MRKIEDYLDHAPNYMRKKNYENKLKILVKKKKQDKKAEMPPFLRSDELVWNILKHFSLINLQKNKRLH